MKKYIITIIILLFAIFISNIECYAKRYALVIGNGSYKNVPLNNPVNDANDIANILQELNFNVSKKTNANKQEIINSIRNFENKITSTDVALFYYSGHGLQVNGINYIIPIGADITDEDEIEFEAVAMNRIMSKLEKARINIIILDACRDNPFKGFKSLDRGLAQISTKTYGTFIAYATAPGKVAVDGTGRNSPYTKNLISKMKIPGLKIEDVFKEVRKAVKQETNNKQIPWDSSSLTDDFVFAMSCSHKITEPEEKPKIEHKTYDNMVFVKGGTFMMGNKSSDGKDNEKPIHSVSVDDFYISKHEVTQKEWKEIMGTNPSHRVGDDLPVECVNWYDAIEYCNKKSIKEGFTPCYTIDKFRIDPNNKNNKDKIKWAV